ncbi:signal recognition particle subunit SRP54 [Acrasis kona]|uniref:signal-recognition-particle GTPase n=1 Tax=Acrasis kona TaxID=1008807 RepID=A0AAW2YSS1_9EUKA
MLGIRLLGGACSSSRISRTVLKSTILFGGKRLASFNPFASQDPFSKQSKPSASTGMFSMVSNKIKDAFSELTAKKTLTEEDVKSALDQVRVAMLNADIPVDIVDEIIKEASDKSVGERIVGRKQKLPEAATVFRIVQNKLVQILGVQEGLQFMKQNYSTQNNRHPPYRILMAGIQGSGKTTTSAKLALNLKNRNFKVLLTSLDVHRPAAQQQLEKLAKQISVDSVEIVPGQTPMQITERTLKEAKEGNYDIIIFDTAGRLQVDQELMNELGEVSDMIRPDETLLCADAMLGNEAVGIAKAFNDKLTLSGIVLTRMDGDVRGGAAISMRYNTGVPIKYLGSGERLEDLDSFIPEGVASKLLGESDIASLAQKAEEVSKMSPDEEKQMLERFKSGKFTFDDYMEKLETFKSMGSVKNIAEKFGVGSGEESVDTYMEYYQQCIDDYGNLLLNLTPDERSGSTTYMAYKLDSSKRLKLANKSGVRVELVNKMLKSYEQVKKSSLDIARATQAVKDLNMELNMDTVAKQMRSQASDMQKPKVKFQRNYIR